LLAARRKSSNVKRCPVSQHDDRAAITPLPAAKSGAGEFFVVDRRAFAAASALGLNPAVAYLTIARGAGSRPKSHWSVDSIERYTGISRPKAKIAVKTLIERGLLTLERAGTRPLYGIVPAHERGLALSIDDRMVLVRVNEDKNTLIPKDLIGIAKDLVRREFLYDIGNGWFSKRYSAARPHPTKVEHIWLPNAIVDGSADETPPLALLRQMQDVRRLELFLRFYDTNDLPNDGGVSRFSLRQNHTLTKVSQRGASTIWSFGPCASTESTGNLHRPFLSGKLDQERKDTGLPDFWAALTAFEACGLVEFIPHVFESDKPEAEMLHAYPLTDGACELWERHVAITANAAGMSCLTADRRQWAIQQAYHLMPVPSHITNLAVIGIARLRYRPRTRMTAAWFAKSKERSEAWQPLYEEIFVKNAATEQKVA
jgi:hypothetical protein